MKFWQVDGAMIANSGLSILISMKAAPHHVVHADVLTGANERQPLSTTLQNP